MKKLLFCTICIATALMMISCGGKKDGPASEVLSKKNFSSVIAKYETVGDFHDGVAVVSVEWRKNGVIDTKGKEIIECKYSQIDDSCDGMLTFKDGSNYGCFNTKGEVVVETGKYDYVNNYSCGLVLVEKDGKYGYVDTKGVEVVPCNFEVARSFSEEVALVRMNGKYGYIDLKGNYIVQPSYDDAEDFSCGVAITCKGSNEYIIDRKGNVVYTVDKKSTFIDEQFAHNLMPMIQESGRSLVAGYINTKGDIALPFEYQYATGFVDGTALVMKDNKVYKINTKGEILSEETSPEILEDFLDEATYLIDLSTDVLVKLLGEEFLEDW